MTLMRLHSPFNAFVEDLFNNFPATPQERAFAPLADVQENEKAFVIDLDLPGVNPDDIDVKVEGNLLSVNAKRMSKTEETKEGVVRRERSWGTYTRSFTLPDTVDSANFEAAYRHGVLTLTLPKKAEQQPRSVKIKVSA